MPKYLIGTTDYYRTSLIVKAKSKKEAVEKFTMGQGEKFDSEFIERGEVETIENFN